MATAEKVNSSYPFSFHPSITDLSLGGKAKPLKAPKKDKKDLDEDEVAFRNKQKAGMCATCAII